MIRLLRAGSGLPLTQAAVLGRLDREGSQSIGQLAASERVRPQSMSQLLAELEAEGLVTRATDERDGRRIMISLTPKGASELLAERERRSVWLAEGIAEFSDEEIAALAAGIELLRRLTDRR